MAEPLECVSFDDFSAEVRINLSSMKPAKDKDGQSVYLCGHCTDNPIFADFQNLIWHHLMNHFENCSFYCSLCFQSFGLGIFPAHLKKHFNAFPVIDDRNKNSKKDILDTVIDCDPVLLNFENSIDSDSSSDDDVPLKTKMEAYKARKQMENDSSEDDKSYRPSDEEETKSRKKKKKKVKDNHICTICNKVYAWPYDLKRHVKAFHCNGKKFQCDVCKKEFRKREGLKSHYRVHTGEKPYVCAQCGKKFSLQSNLNRHVMVHTGEKPYLCTVCGKAFKQSSHLKSHVQSHANETNGDGQLRRPALPKKERPFQCSHCPRSFSLASRREVHLRTHTGEKPFKCTHCDKAFTQGSFLKLHISNIHTKDGKYQCEVCNKKFGDKQTWKKHLRIHTGEKPYSCTVCGKSFNMQGNLSRHKRIHTGEKPFLCTLCGRAFLLASHLKTHLKCHSNDKQPRAPSKSQSSNSTENFYKEPLNFIMPFRIP